MDQHYPAREVEVDPALVEALLADQHPRFLGGAVHLADEGWDNFTFRIGETYAARLPRREPAVKLLLNEQRWLPQISGRVAIAVPAPVAVGEPSKRFRWPWSVVPWISGTTAEDAPLDAMAGVHLATLLRQLHVAAPADAPANPFRGLPLEDRREVVENRLSRAGDSDLDLLWHRSLRAPAASEGRWLHGDLHPRNLIVSDGKIAGIIDWGDMTAGDVATDLACAWMLFERPARRAFIDAYGPTADEIVRASGWALNFGLGMAESAEPRHERLGTLILQRLRGDADL